MKNSCLQSHQPSEAHKEGRGLVACVSLLFSSLEGNTHPLLVVHTKAQKQEGPGAGFFRCSSFQAVQKKTDDTTSVTLIDLLPVQANPRLLYSRLRT